MNLYAIIIFITIKLLEGKSKFPKFKPDFSQFGGITIRWYVGMYSRLNITNIEQGLQMIMDRSCVQFLREIDNPKDKKAPFIEFEDNTSCYVNDFNFKGDKKLMKKPYKLKIERGCNSKPGCIAKKVLFYMGMPPTIRRKDRNKYIKLDLKNVSKCYRKEFDILKKADLYKTGYDYSSLGHISPFYRGLFGQRTYSIKNSNNMWYLLNAGQEYGPSFTDYKWLFNRFCTKQCPNKLKCQNGGFQNFEGCSYCDCPNGYKGDCCDEIDDGQNCDMEKNMVATKENRTLTFFGIKLCYIQIKAKRGKKIKLSVSNGRLPSYNPCFEMQALTIKHKKDKSLTGLSLCTFVDHLHLTSEDETVLIQYKGESKNNMVKVSFMESGC